MPAKKVTHDVHEAPPQPVAPQAPVNGATAELPVDAFFAPKPPSNVLDDFDLESFRASDTPLAVPVDEGISAVRVRKPKGTDFVFVHPTWRALVFCIPEEFRRREAHLVLPTVAASHPDICKKMLLVPYCNDGCFFLWPVGQEDATGRVNDWSKSAMQQIARAADRGRWCQFAPSTTNQSYILFEAVDERDAPSWPPDGIAFLIKKAFEDRIISTKDHPLFRQLRGRKVD